MAEMGGEAAFLASMAGDEYDPTQEPSSIDQQDDEIPLEEVDEDDDDDYDPSSFMPDAPAVATSAPASAPASATPEPAPVDASQPPSDVPSQPPSQAPSRTASAQPSAAVQTAQKPKTIGGFIEEEDDDEDEEEAQTATAQHDTNGFGDLAVASQTTPLHDPTPSLSHTPSQLNTQVYNAPKDAAPSDPVPNGADSVSTPTSVLQSQPPQPTESKPATPIPQQSSAVPASSSTSTSTSKPRLPQDQIGKLEDRIAEDPKGDVNAWLELIALYRAKNKLEDARQVYERFFEVFPTAVSIQILFSMLRAKLTGHRASNGWLLPTWSSRLTISSISNRSSARPYSRTTMSNFGAFTSTTFGGATTS